MPKGKHRTLFLCDPDKGAGTDPAVPPSTGAAPNATTAPTQEPKFTQADLDRILSERLARTEAKYADYADLKAKVEASEAASKSELEKTLDRATKAEARAKEVEREAKLAHARLSATTIAGELGFDPKRTEKVLRLIEINDDSTPETLRKALETLASEMPEFLKGKQTPPATGATNPAKGSGEQPETDAQRQERLRGGGAFSDWARGGRVEFNPQVNAKQRPAQGN